MRETLIVGVLTTLTLLMILEVTLRRWAGRPMFDFAASQSRFSQHDSDGSGHWSLSAEEIARMDVECSPIQLQEVAEWLRTRGSRWRDEYSMPHAPSVTLNRLSDEVFKGTKFSIRNFERTTTDQPSHPSNELLCLGGSTTFCIEVSDSNTWPSILQRRLNTHSETVRFQVRNLGIGGTPGIERILSYKLAIRPKHGDIAVFLFGDNDVGWKQYGDRTGMVHQHLPIVVRYFLKLSSRIELASWIYGEISAPYLRKLAKESAKANVLAAEEVALHAKSLGARVLFVLQPNLFTLARWSEADRRIASATARDLAIMVRAAYETYEEWIRNSDVAVSASHIFDLEEASPYMGDWCHVNSRGNSLISEAVFRELESRGWLDGATSIAQS